MNSQGYTKDNIHKGNTKIVAGGIDVDGLVRVGDQSVAGDGYVLPAVKGTEGQVLTMNADKTTSFQDASSGSLTRIGSGNNDTVSASGGTTNQGFLPSFTGVRITDIKNIPAGSSYVIEAQSVVEFTYDGTSPSIISYLQTNLNLILGGTSSNTATISNQANSNVYPSPIVVGNIYRSYWYYKAVITRSDTGSTFNLNTFSTMNRFGNTNYLVNMNTTPNPPNFLAIDGDPNDTTLDFTFQFDNFLGSGTAVTYEKPSINWYISQLGQVNAPELLTNDHTQLTNLNSGDSGHTQFALLQGRSGGQVLSGGLTPLHFLTLKSHNIGLNNIVVKDLNTTFEKDIDLDNNSLLNGLGVNTQFLLATTQTETPLVVGSGGGALAITSNDLTLTENNLPSGEYMNFNNTRALTYKTLDMNTNDITNANVIVRASNGNVINFDNDTFPPLITGALTIESGAGKEININADNVLRLNGNSIIHNSGTGPHQFNDTGGLQVQFTSANIEMFKALDMKNNNINSVASLTATQVNTDTIENSGSGFLTFTNLGSYTPSFTPSALDMNLGNINNVDTIENTGSANITLPVVIGTPSGALQVKNGGAYIKQDLQVDGNIYCDSINNIRPSGGLYSESSGFNIPSTNLTETNLLGQGGSAGTLAIPANTFTQFDSYSFKASGVLSGGSNDTATLRLKSLVNGTTPVELGSIVIQLTDNGLVDVAWKVEADFNVRTLGGAGVGVLVLSGNFAYTNNNDVVKTYLRTIVNNTVFDTTQSNELQFTYQNDGTNPLTNIRIDQASFTKWY